MAFHPLHVIIAGGGLAGLTAAHGLLRAGHTVDVYERHDTVEHRQGYYLHVNPMGGDALERCLPEDLFRLYQATSRVNYVRTGSIVRDEQLHELSSQPPLIPPKEGPFPDTGVHRRQLRQILMARLDDVYHAGLGVASFAQDDAGVTVTLSDGTEVRGDVLVGADGINSAVRRQLLPDVQVVRTGIDGIGIFGRTIITEELQAQLPALLDEGVQMIVDRHGSRLLAATYRPRRPADEACAEIAPDVPLEPVEPYIMASCSVPPGTEIPPAEEWTLETAERIRDAMLAAIDGWHPATRAIIAAMDVPSMFAVPFGFLDPAESWEPSRVTIIGDSAHAMLPTLGMGANVSLNDAAVLVDRLAEVGRGERPLEDAIGAYEAEMRATAYPILRMASHHDENFGGGALVDLAHAEPTA
ncbi:FAD-dependent oxidoreductase [Demequina soli]|uniref:FAD-dependent oxidoreductase n=1 Tax=Demequina soli TaxID=1638987 RepID=UPI0007823BA0|nr:NAD(P)/FAD-dependent oxidoreductase [Demequina soli]